MMIRTKESVILDLEEPNSFAPSLYQLLEPHDVWSHLHEDFNRDYSLFDELSCSPVYVTSALVRDLRDAASNIISSEYTAVAAYHGCRPVNRRSYTEHGLLRTNRHLLSRLTQEAFGQIPNVEVVFERVCRKYLEWYDGTVGLFLSKHEATKYHACCLFLRTMADALGNEGQDLLRTYLARGTPTVVKCMLPLDWLEDRMREPSLGQYASAALQKMILLRAAQIEAVCSFGALGLKCDLPPEMIIKVIDMT